MTTESEKDIARIFREGQPIDEALNAAVGEAIVRHKQQDQPLVVWRGGQTVWISAEEAEQERGPRRSES